MNTGVNTASRTTAAPAAQTAPPRAAPLPNTAPKATAPRPAPPVHKGLSKRMCRYHGG